MADSFLISFVDLLIAAGAIYVVSAGWLWWRRPRDVAMKWERFTTKVLKIDKCPHTKQMLSRSQPGSNAFQTRYICRRCTMLVCLPAQKIQGEMPQLVHRRYG